MYSKSRSAPQEGIILKQDGSPSPIKTSDLLLAGLDRTIAEQADATRRGIMKLRSASYAQ